MARSPSESRAASEPGRARQLHSRERRRRGGRGRLQARYNIAPTDPVDVVKPAANGAAELVPMRWGLVPWWWKKPLKQLPASFDARAETVADKPMFRDAFARHRSVIPASGYYERLKRPDGRQPYFISAAMVAC
jgi:putative SOS response-associated peptidase YedK